MLKKMALVTFFAADVIMKKKRKASTSNAQKIIRGLKIMAMQMIINPDTTKKTIRIFFEGWISFEESEATELLTIF